MKQLMTTRRPIQAAVALTVAVIAGYAAQAQFITSDPNLPPQPPGTYLSMDVPAVSYSSGSLQIQLGDPGFPLQIGNFTGVLRTPSGPNEVENFNAQFSAGGVVFNPGPVGASLFSANGPVSTITYGKIGNTTGTFQTEMLSMALTGISAFGSFMMRESPTLASLGQTTITDIGGGLYRIDSFFDVFTELSIDGGSSWMPDTQGPVHLTLVPEPASLALVGLGLVALVGLKRGRRG